MGLDIVEFALHLERAFDFRFLDEDAQGLATPRLVIDYLAQRLPRADHESDLTDCALAKLSAAIREELAGPLPALQPQTSLRSLIPGGRKDDPWQAIARRLGLKSLPKVGISGCCSFRVLTLGQAAEYLAHEHAHICKAGAQGWTRAEIAQVVHWHICSGFGLRRDQYTDDSRFTEDLGLA